MDFERTLVVRNYIENGTKFFTTMSCPSQNNILKRMLVNFLQTRVISAQKNINKTDKIPIRPL